MEYLFIVLLVVFCVYEIYSMIVSIRKKRLERKNKEFESSTTDLEVNEAEQNSGEIFEKGEKE